MIKKQVEERMGGKKGARRARGWSVPPFSYRVVVSFHRQLRNSTGGEEEEEEVHAHAARHACASHAHGDADRYADTSARSLPDQGGCVWRD